MKLLQCIVAVAAVCVATLTAQAQQSYPSTNRVSLAWDASPSPQITNYSVHVGTASGAYVTKVDVGTNLVCTLTNLAPATTYFFAATAENVFALVSDYSNEVSYTTPRPKPLPPGQLKKTAP
jgi:hypothetical protein